MYERDITEILTDLPPMCAARLPTDGSPVMLHRGVPGYTPWRPGFDVEGYNARHGVTPAQVQAMEMGAAFGWHLPCADPLNYTDLEQEI